MAPIDYSALRAQTMGAGQDDAVTVNTRALIDKVLARYSGDWTVLRELLQNAADASATKVSIRFDTLPSSTVPLPQTKDSSSLLRHTILNHTIRSLHVTNNGTVFGSNDWDRLKRIAEGNPDETKIGAFGVGFYSVFDCCEEPFVQSGKEAMAFYWKENGLFTKRLRLPDEQATPDTTFVLDYRNTTSPVPPLLPICQFLAGSMTFVGLSEIELWVDKWKLLHLRKLNAPGVKVAIPKTLKTKTPDGLMRVESVTNEAAQLSAQFLSVVGWKPEQEQKPNIPDSSAATTGGSLRSFFTKFASSTSKNAAAEKAANEEKALQQSLSEKLVEEITDTIFMRVARADISTSVSKNFANELERATKKPPPRITKVAIMTSSFTGSDNTLSSVGERIFTSVVPSKNGRIFIGQITNQTTGLSAHISAQSVIPTVEREAIDLQARWVRTWNEELLRACGIVCRLTWMDEIDAVRQSIAHSMSAAGRTKVAAGDVEKAIPEAVHILTSFTFRDSTPNNKIGALVEEAFWTCNSASSIEILSSRGVLLSQDVRIGTSELSFVDGIPVVPPQILDKAGGFVRKLVEYGVITDVTASDIRKELEAQALTSKQLSEFIKWVTAKVKAHEFDSAAAQRMMEVTVANDEELGRPIVLSEVTTFLTPTKIPPNMPVPPNVVPHKFTSGIDRVDLEQLGWVSLEIVPWIRWLLGNADSRGVLSEDEDILSSPKFAGQVLPIISKQWDGLSQSSKQTVINLLKSRTVMPTKLGMRRPEESYFPSVKLFEDLPVMTVSSVKDKVAVALGVRKTIDLNLVFDRLLKPQESVEGGAKPWNHVDLVKYLASVRNDIPKDDIKRLTETPLCPAETSQGPSKILYKASELFEPSDELRALNFKVIQWPGILRKNTEDGKFLSQIGLRVYPNVTELIEVAHKALLAKDTALHNRVIRYIVAYHATHGYSAREIGQTKVPFLPLEGSKDLFSSPMECFTNMSIASMGFPILRKDLHMYADRLGVRENMPVDQAVMWLIKNPPDTHRRARELFEYFATRLHEIHGEPLAMLQQANIVPVSKMTGMLKSIRLRPTSCFLGSGGKYADIFDYVDFGSVANAFLLRLGAKGEPTIQELAWMVVNEPARIFSTFNSAERYMDLLTQLAVSLSSLTRDKTLLAAMRKAPFLLAFKELPPAYSNPKTAELGKAAELDEDEEQDAIKTYQLASASQVVIIDDAMNFHIFREHLLAAPLDETIESLYSALGVTTLSVLIEERSKVAPALPDQRPAEHLKRLIVERMKLFFHGMSKEQIRHDTQWLDTKLRYLAVESISVRKTLRGTNASHLEKRSAALVTQNLQPTLCITNNMRDLYEVSIELLRLCLFVPKPERAIILTNLLESPLQLLRQRGYNVDRILRRRQQEARIAAEARQKQMEEEEQRLAVRAQLEAPKGYSDQNTSAHAPMPGAFDFGFDSFDEDRNSSSNRHNSLWSRFSDALGGDKRRSKQLQAAGASSPKDLKPIQGSTKQVGKPITSPAALEQNLLQAIKQSKAFNKESVISQGKYNDVAETKTFCDSKPAQNIRLLAEVGIMKVFISKDYTESQAASWMGANGSALMDFSNVLLSIANVMNIRPESMHIFYDPESQAIAFNHNKSLFFNYHYYESLHLSNVQRGDKADAIVYWFVSTSHELAHNLETSHSQAHTFYTESFISMYFTKVARLATGMPLGDQDPPKVPSK